MNRKPTSLRNSAPPVPAEDNFLRRWSRRKLASQQDSAPQPPAEDEAGISAAPAELTDADMPPLEVLNFDSDYSGFLSNRVSDELRRTALRKLFHMPELNVVDGLDDYARDYTQFVPLGDTVTADMRYALERLNAVADRQPERTPPESVSGHPPSSDPGGPAMTVENNDGHAAEGTPGAAYDSSSS